MKSSLTIVKVGGAVVEQAQSLSTLLHGFAQIGGNKILVHGGGRTATALASRLGIETKMVDGRRITDNEMLNVVTMVYGGLVNKRIVSALSALDIRAVGLTGADMGVIRSHRRPITPRGVDYGFVGDVDKVDAGALKMLVDGGIVPVVAPLTLGAEGQLLNTNADTIAASVAKAMAALYDVTLVFCFEKKGVLRNPDDEDSVIPAIDAANYETLKKDGIISGGMLPKLDNAFSALRTGVKNVVITRADSLAANSGTTITL